MTGSSGRPYHLTCLTWTYPGAPSAGTGGQRSAAADSAWETPPSVPALGTEDVHAWRVPLTLPQADLLALRRLLSADELARAKRLRLPADRHRFIASRGALRQILSGYLNTEAQRLQFRYGPHGKPSLAGPAEPCPLEQPPLHFSLSHSADLALVAVSRGRRVGVDVERVCADVSSEVVARCFSRREQDELQSLPAHIQHLAFFDCWTRKEAYLKARGEGLSIPLHRFDVSLAPGQPARLLHSAGDPDECSRWSLADLRPGPGFVATLAVETLVDGDAGDAGRSTTSDDLPARFPC